LVIRVQLLSRSTESIATIKETKMRVSRYFVLVALLIVAALVPVAARADSVSFTLYCTDGNNCSTTQPGSGGFFTFTCSVTTTGTSFDMQLNITETNEDPASLLSWSLTAFTGDVSNLSTGESGKSNNGSDDCNNNVSGAVCFSKTDLGGGAPLPYSVDVTGNFTGSLLGSGQLVFLADGAFTSGDNSGKTAFAVSQETGTTNNNNNNNNNNNRPLPEPASLALFGSGLVGISAMLRRRLKK